MVRTAARRPVDQLDLFAELDEAQRLVEAADAQRRFDEAPAIFDTGTAGLRVRLEVFEAWVAKHGHFNCFLRSHGWHHATTCEGPTEATARCMPAVLSADLRCGHHQQKCCCVGSLVYRAACTACDWEGDVRDNSAAAGEDAHDHAWPGWRALPLVPRPPERGSHPRLQARLADWLENVTSFYPAGWVEAGGPIRTDRARMGTRHVPNATGFGGWDMAAPPGQEQP